MILEGVHCASCDKLMPLAGFGLTRKPKEDIRFLCLDCYDSAIAEARATYHQLFPDVRFLNLDDDTSQKPSD